MQILQKSTSRLPQTNGDSDKEEKFKGLAKEKLVSFYEQVLMEAFDLQSSVGETTNKDVH